MRYHYVKSTLLCEAAVSIAIALLGIFVIAYKAGLPIGFVEIFFAVLLVILLALGVRSWHNANKLKASAILDESGIHIITKEEICLITWQEVYACNLIPAGSNARPPYMLVILDAKAIIDDTLAIHVNTPVSDKTAKRYRLDETMESLAADRISAQEFKDKKVFLVGVTKRQYQKIHSWWENTKSSKG